MQYLIAAIVLLLAVVVLAGASQYIAQKYPPSAVPLPEESFAYREQRHTVLARRVIFYMALACGALSIYLAVIGVLEIVP